jgi:hypothetical protein
VVELLLASQERLGPMKLVIVAERSLAASAIPIQLADLKIQVLSLETKTKIGKYK